MLRAYRRYNPDEEVAREVVESDSSTRSNAWLFGAISLKDMIDFYDKKEEVMIKQKIRRNIRQVSRDPET